MLQLGLWSIISNKEQKMRNFHSYSPIDRDDNYFVERKELVYQCTKQLLGNIDKGGCYFRVWGARQTGKTWLYRQSLDEIQKNYSDQFIAGEISMQGIVFEDNDNHTEIFFKNITGMFKSEFSIEINLLPLI